MQHSLAVEDKDKMICVIWIIWYIYIYNDSIKKQLFKKNMFFCKKKKKKKTCPPPPKKKKNLPPPQKKKNTQKVFFFNVHLKEITS